LAKNVEFAVVVAEKVFCLFTSSYSRSGFLNMLYYTTKNSYAHQAWLLPPTVVHLFIEQPVAMPHLLAS